MLANYSHFRHFYRFAHFVPLFRLWIELDSLCLVTNIIQGSMKLYEQRFHVSQTTNKCKKIRLQIANARRPTSAGNAGGICETSHL